MPTYGHGCPCGHAFDTFLKTPDRRNDPVECPECGGMAPRDDKATPPMYAKTRPAPASRNERGVRLRNPETVPTVTMHDFVCDVCGGSDLNAIVDTDEGDTLSDRPCPDCSKTMRWVPSSCIDRHSERFPYFDMGAGRWFSSKQEVRDWAKANNVECMEGEGEAVFNEAAKLDNEAEAREFGALAETLELYETHPAYKKTWGELKEQGKVDPTIMEGLP